LLTAYGASKAGVEAFAHTLRCEVHHRGVDVGIAYLGWTDTPMARDREKNPLLEEIKSRLPWPMNTTQALEPAVTRIVNGVARRAPHIVTPRWITPLRLARGAMSPLCFRSGSREMRRLDERTSVKG
jgi:NAD(P)-dependent dehydrogenase (short-subunit alcohol dehydrogenase family)